MTTKKPITPAIPPKEYNAILAQVELEEIALEECSAKIRKDKIAKSLQISIKDKISNKQEEGTAHHTWITHSYELVASSDSKRDFAFKITGVFRATYSAKVHLTEEFLDIFIERSVPMHTWPYFRELVQNLTQRMNIPPLTLPLLR